jgi:hypothetical protein
MRHGAVLTVSLFGPAYRSVTALMMDVAYLALTVVLLVASWGLVRLCQRV